MANPGEIAAPASRPAIQKVFNIAVLVLVASAILAAVLMARWSTKSGRADRRGAWRLAAFVGVSQWISVLLVMGHVADPREVPLLGFALTMPAFSALAVWTLYLALEPYIRRAWPSALISWNRVLQGRFRDVRVARDVLVGVAATGAIVALDPLTAALKRSAPRGLDTSYWRAASDLRELLAGMVDSLDGTLFIAFMLVFFFCLIRMMVRRDWMAATVFAVLLGALLGGGSALMSGSSAWALVGAAVGLLLGGVTVGLLVRFGLIAVIAQNLTQTLLSNVVTLSPSPWYSASSFFNLAAVMLITAWAGWTCFSATLAAAPAAASAASVQLMGT
jgi:hypothetical protein